MIQVDLQELIAFYDEDKDARKHANSIKILAGEEIGLFLLQEYFRQRDMKPELLARSCTTGKRRGKRLDGWLKVHAPEGTIYYQVEVKTWSFHGIGGGDPLPVDCTNDYLRQFKQKEWEGYWDEEKGQFKNEMLNKVLTPMKRPEPTGEVRPLACIWSAVHPTGEPEAFFHIPTKGSTGFERVYIFSMSAFLREQRKVSRFLCLELPKTCQRLQYVERIFKVVAPLSPP